MTKRIAYMGIGIALYVVLSFAVKIPLIGHIQTDLGYIAFGVFLYIFGYPAIVVGVMGCVIESLLMSGWFPYGWFVGQIVIGLMCAYAFTKTNQKWLHIFAIIFSVFVGIVVIKTIIECVMFGIPLAVKIPKNIVAWVVDVIPMIIGLLIGYRLKDKLIRGEE
jgi:hypothetical protein